MQCTNWKHQKGCAQPYQIPPIQEQTNNKHKQRKGGWGVCPLFICASNNGKSNCRSPPKQGGAGGGNGTTKTVDTPKLQNVIFFLQREREKNIEKNY
jgi:hypothetical protein